jgi:hypothetical protein
MEAHSLDIKASLRIMAAQPVDVEAPRAIQLALYVDMEATLEVLPHRRDRRVGSPWSHETSPGIVARGLRSTPYAFYSRKSELSLLSP